MNLLFVHDVKTLIFNGKAYARSYGPSIWQRYLNTFDQVTVCTRSSITQTDISKSIEELTGNNVVFDSRIGMFKGPDAFFSKRVWKIIRENIQKSDGIIVRLDSFLGLIAVAECIRQKKPFVTEVVGCAWDSFWNHGTEGKILAPIMFFLMKLAVKKSPFTIYVTKRFLQKRYPTHGMSTNISNVSLPAYNETILENRLTKISQTNLSEVPIHLMTTANVGVRYKGFQFVLKAIKKLSNEYNRTNFVYHIVGEGDQTYLRNLAKKLNIMQNVVFHGPISHENVFKLLQEIDIYIQPSLQEGLPRAMIEAMSCALPCIGSDVAGIPELINPKYIYTRNRKMPDQIARILFSFNKEDMKQEALDNFEAAKEYQANLLNKRRNNFLQLYKNSL